MAHDYVFLNSGISDKLNDTLDINGNRGTPSQVSEFSWFIKDNTDIPSKTQDKFTWTDGALRSHTVSVTVDKPTPSVYEVRETHHGRGYINQQILDILFLCIAMLIALYTMAYGLDITTEDAEPWPPCDGWINGYWCTMPGVCFDIGMGQLSENTLPYYATAHILYYKIKGHLDDIWDAVQETWKEAPQGKTVCRDDTNIGENILVTITDVADNRKIKVTTFQTHEGKDLGLWQAQYPQINSESIATYNCDPTVCYKCESGACTPIDVCNKPYPDCSTSPLPCNNGFAPGDFDYDNICDRGCSCVDGWTACLGHQPQLSSH